VAGAGLRYAYVHDTNVAVSASDNSAGGVNSVTTLGPGGCPVPARPRRRAGYRSQRPTRPSPPSATWPRRAGHPGALLGRAGRAAAVGLSLTYRSGRAVTGAAPRLRACTLNNQPLVAGPYALAPPGISFSSADAAVVRDVNCSLLSGRDGRAQSLVSYDTNS
jgi:hypothetical protein